jgi:predicted enzyme related to lactoylglutathione lyase
MNTKDHPKLKSMSPLLLVTDLNRSIEFYTKKLGFEISFCYEDFYCGITRDGHSIHLKLVDAPVKAGENEQNNENLEITFAVDGIEAHYEDLKKRAVTIIEPLRDMPYGREFYIADPDENIIAFIE